MSLGEYVKEEEQEERNMSLPIHETEKCAVCGMESDQITLVDRKSVV